MLYNSALVEIFVKTSAGDAKGGELATGYAVAKGLILTARHAVFPKDDNGKPKPVHGIYVRWYHQQGAARDRIALGLADYIAWDGYEKLGLDVVLLKCDFPDGVAYKGDSLSTQRPELDLAWESEGFARAGQLDQTRPPTKIWGDMPSHGDADSATFTLGAKYPPKTDSGWKGASGSPVMLKTGAIIGVIESCQANFNAALLNATPVWKLLQDDVFRAAIGYAEPPEWTLWAQDKLREILGKSESHRKILAQHLGLDGKQLDALTDALLARDSSLFEQLNRLFLELAKSPSSELREWLKEILAVLLPTRLDPGVLSKLQAQKQDVRCVSVEIPVASLPAAERAMAALDRRPMRFIALEDPTAPGNRALRAALAVHLPPETGIDADGSAFIDAFADHLIDKTCVCKELPLNHKTSRDELIRAAAEELAYRAEEENSTHYFIYAVPDNPSWKQRCSANAQTLSDLFPSIIFVNLTGTQLTQERRDFRPLRKLWGIE